MNGDIRRFLIPIERAQIGNVIEIPMPSVTLENNTPIQPSATFENNMPIQPSVTLSETDATNDGIIHVENGLEFEFIPGKRQKSKLVFLTKEKYIFTPINSDAKHGTRYSCITPNCPARIIVRNNGICVVSQRSKPHIVHIDHLQKREEYISAHQIKQKCTDIDILCGGSGINVSVKSTMRWLFERVAFLILCLYRNAVRYMLYQ